jgi:galactokinase
MTVPPAPPLPQPLPLRASVADRFVTAFGRAPRLFQAPGRLNIIGEHVDYCGGPVLPAAIDRRVVVAAAANATGVLRVHSAFGTAQLACDGVERFGDWRDHVAGAARALEDFGMQVAGCDLVIDSDVPMGAGVSSSAALGVALVLALSNVSGCAVRDGVLLARIAQHAESVHVGVPCGIMDQFASANGIAGHALALDCATLQFVAVPVPDTARFLVINSGQERTLAHSAYAERRADCEAAARTLGVAQLADVTDWGAAAPRLSGNALRRARHVIGECARVRDAIAALRVGDLVALGALMTASHASLRDDMAVSCDAADALVAAALATPGVLGARMMGGGFGGSVIALAAEEEADPALAAILAAHAATMGKPIAGFVATLASGAGEVS